MRYGLHDTDRGHIVPTAAMHPRTPGKKKEAGARLLHAGDQHPDGEHARHGGGREQQRVVLAQQREGGDGGGGADELAQTGVGKRAQRREKGQEKGESENDATCSTRRRPMNWPRLSDGTCRPKGRWRDREKGGEG